MREREEEHLHHTNRAPGHDRVNEDICVYAHGVACVECIMCIVLQYLYITFTIYVYGIKILIYYYVYGIILL